LIASARDRDFQFATFGSFAGHEFPVDENEHLRGRTGDGWRRFILSRSNRGNGHAEEQKRRDKPV
jgi:hypothetical protein